MQQIYHEQHLPIHAQVMLLDAEDIDVFPEWGTGKEAAVIGVKGALVATASSTGDLWVDVIVYTGDGQPVGTMCLAGEIQVGHEGLLIGTDAGCDVNHLVWPSGRTTIRIYVNGSPNEVTQVIFLLKSLAS